MTKSSSHCRSSARTGATTLQTWPCRSLQPCTRSQGSYACAVLCTRSQNVSRGALRDLKRAPWHALLPPDNTTWVARPAVHATKFIIVAGEQRVCTCYMYNIIRVISPQAISLTSALNKGWAYNTSRVYIRIYHIQASYTYTRTLSWRGGGLVIHHGLIIRTIR